ncbi:hypothetical protein [Nocardioides sp. 616]|uniref:hypothetical protein n=1 Tax=Nocardioides sp. 616 TaxID=2268090 RepID=UPI0013B37A17|nr:hypothetical protein [Nocardioides sp. 616]
MRNRIGAALTALALCLSAFTPSVATATPSAATAAPERASGPSAAPGMYRGNILVNGRPVKAQPVEFQVTRGGKVEDFHAVVRLTCDDQGSKRKIKVETDQWKPVKVKKGRVEAKWTDYLGSGFTFLTQLVMKLRPGRPVVGRVQVSVSWCNPEGTWDWSTSGWVPFVARKAS